jgi:hypothetical protein
VGRPSQSVYRRYNRPDEPARVEARRIGGDGAGGATADPEGRISV